MVEVVVQASVHFSFKKISLSCDWLVLIVVTLVAMMVKIMVVVVVVVTVMISNISGGDSSSDWWLVMLVGNALVTSFCSPLMEAA